MCGPLILVHFHPGEDSPRQSKKVLDIRPGARHVCKA